MLCDKINKNYVIGTEFNNDVQLEKVKEFIDWILNTGEGKVGEVNNKHPK